MKEESFCPKCGCDVFECSGAVTVRCSNAPIKTYRVNTYTKPMFAEDNGEGSHIEQAYSAEDAAYQVLVRSNKDTRVTAVHPYNQKGC
jgi:uncharacterized Zn finger protein (UPF0148 family)